MKIKGNTIKVGDDIDTDLIIPGRYLQNTNIQELKKHIFEDLRTDLNQKIDQNTILIAGKHFGAGSSREHAPQVIKESGISAIIAKSYDRIFYRNAINIGLPIFKSPIASKKIQEGAKISINTTKQQIKNLNNGKTYQYKKTPEFLDKIIEKGGIIQYTKNKLENSEK